jgi:hypothetical protein
MSNDNTSCQGRIAGRLSTSFGCPSRFSGGIESGIVVFVRNDHGAESGKGEHAIHITILIFAGLLISWPLLLHGFPELSNDGPNHAVWSNNYARQMWSGDWYPRWLSNMNDGLGSPDFFYYPPLHAFVSALFWPLVAARDPHGYLISGFSAVLATLLSGLTAYAWIRSLTTERAAVVGAVVYMIVPYHVAIDLYNRGAAAEYWLFVWLPLVMLYAQRIIEGVPYSAVWLAVTFALCAYSHGTVAAVFAAVPIVYVVLFSQPGSRIRQIFLAGVGIGAGIGLAAVYLLPASMDRYKAFVADQTVGWGDYRNWWLFQIRNGVTEAGTIGAGFPWYLSYKMRVAVITVWMAGFCILAYIIIRKRSSSSRTLSHAAFYTGLTVVCFFLNLESSDFIWRMTPVLQLIQIAHRLDTMISMSAAVLAAMVWASFGQQRARAGIALLSFCVFGWFVADMVAARQGYARWRHIPAERVASSVTRDEKQMEYYILWPIEAPAYRLAAPADFDRFVSVHPPKTAAFTGSASGQVQVGSDWRPRHFELSVRAPAAGHIIVNHFYYQGWTAVRKDTGTPIPLTHTSDGLMDLTVPQGDYTLAIDLPRDLPERAGAYISLFSIFFCGGLALLEFKLPRAGSRFSVTSAQARSAAIPG